MAGKTTIHSQIFMRVSVSAYEMYRARLATSLESTNKYHFVIIYS